MKSFAAYLAGAVLLGLAGVACLGVARLDDHLADAVERLNTLEYGAAADSLALAEPYVARARWVPWLGDDAGPEISARRAALQYWQRQYEAVVPAQPDPVTAVDPSNVELQLVVANGVYRQGQMRGEDRKTRIAALEEAALSYLTVLKSETWHPEAAFNYEFAIRLRDLLAKGRQPPPPNEDDGDHGQSGSPGEEAEGEFQIYIPLDQGERTPEGGEAGEEGPRERKG
jgi:hypothetical protein